MYRFWPSDPSLYCRCNNEGYAHRIIEKAKARLGLNQEPAHAPSVNGQQDGVNNATTEVGEAPASEPVPDTHPESQHETKGSELPIAQAHTSTKQPRKCQFLYCAVSP